MAAFKLRDYQVEDLCSMIAAAQRVKERPAGVPPDRVLCILPTGAGKTLLMLAFARALRKRWGWRTLITVPFRNLIHQTANAIREKMPDLSFGLIGDGHFDLEGDVVVAVQASLAGEKLQKIPRDAFQLVVFDEAHHAAAESYQGLLTHFDSAKLIMGMTATYIRGDDVSIASDQYFPDVIVWNTVGQLTRAGYLVEAVGYYKYTGISIDEVKVRNGKFVEGQLSHAVNIPERNEQAVDAWFEFMEGYPSVAYCVDIAHAKDLAAAFNSQGVPAAAVWGRMPDDDYRKIMEDYRAGKILVLANAKLLTEGWDAPLTAGILMARPVTKTSANVLVPQMFGRALRPDPGSGKTHAVIVELRDQPKKKEQDDENISVSGLAAFAKTPEADLICGRVALHDQASRSSALKGWRERRKLLEELTSPENLQIKFSVIERLAMVSAYAWVPLGTTLYMPLAEGDFIEVVQETPWSYEIRLCLGGELSIVGVASKRDRAISLADQWVTRNIANKSLLLRSAKWRNNKPSRGQIGYAQALTGLAEPLLLSLTCGQVSDLIKSARALLIEPNKNFSRTNHTEPQIEYLRPFTLHAWQVQPKLKSAPA